MSIRTSKNNNQSKLPVLSPELREVKDRMESFGRVISKVDSVLAARTVPVRFAKTTFGTAMTDGTTITIDSRRMENAMWTAVENRDFGSLASVTAWALGLNYHETSHVLYTPRHTHKPVVDILKMSHSQARQAFNVLEDQRIEGLFLAQYPPAKAYFVRMISEFILNGSSIESPHLLLHGRRYLGTEVRAAARREWEAKHGTAMSAQAMDIIDEYRTFSFPADAARALVLVNDFAHLLDLVFADPSHNPFDSHEHKSGKVSRSDVAEGHKIREEVEANEPDDEEVVEVEVEVEAGTGEGGEESEEGSPSDGEGEGDSPEATDEEATSEAGGSGASRGSGSMDDWSPDNDEETSREILEAMREKAEEETTEDAFDTIVAANKEYQNAHSVEVGEIYKRAFGSRMMMETHSKVARDTLVRTLEELEGAAHSDWIRRVDSGRLNVPALMESRGAHLDVFDSWNDVGEDSTSTEVVVLVDLSGSMEGLNIEETSKGMWVLTSACEALDIPITVLGYANGGVVLHTPGTLPAYRRLRCGGGTEPGSSLDAAQRIFDGSDARHKLLFSLTDGMWQDSHGDRTNVERVEEIREGGVTTMMLHLDNYYRGISRYASSYPAETNGHEIVIRGPVRKCFGEISNQLAGAFASR